MDSARRKVICTLITSSLVFILFCLTISLGWFSKNRDVQPSGIRIVVEKPNLITIKEYQVYKRDGIEDRAVMIADNTTDESFKFEMTEYDTVFLDRNVNTPIVVRVVIENVEAENNVLPKMIAHVKCNSNAFKDNDGNMENYLSNIINVKGGPINDVVNYQLKNYDPVEDSDEIYNGVIDAFKEDDGNTYVNKTTYNTKTNFVKIDMVDYELVNDDEAIIYFVFNYDEDLIAEYINEHGIVIKETSDLGDDMIYYTFDINSIEFTFKKDDAE